MPAAVNRFIVGRSFAVGTPKTFSAVGRRTDVFRIFWSSNQIVIHPVMPFGRQLLSNEIARIKCITMATLLLWRSNKFAFPIIVVIIRCVFFFPFAQTKIMNFYAENVSTNGNNNYASHSTLLRNHLKLNENTWHTSNWIQ